MTVPWSKSVTLVAEVASEDDVRASLDRVDVWQEIQGHESVAKQHRETTERAGTLPKAIPLLTELQAEWRYINAGFQFKFPNGTVLSWWPRTGSIWWQGTWADLPRPSTVEEALTQYKERFATVAPDYVVPSTPVCMVCGKVSSFETCGVCERSQGDLCFSCFVAAHWC